MSNPFTQGLTAAGPSSGGNPFAPGGGATPASPPNPFASGLTQGQTPITEIGPNGPLPTTAIGIRDADLANRAQNIERLKEMLKRPNITPAQKARIERMIEQFDDPMFYNRVTEDRFYGSNALRGLATGLINEGSLGTVDLAAMVAQAGTSLVDAIAGTEGAKSIKSFREGIAERQETVKQFFDPQGVTASVTRVAGALAGGAPAYGKVGALATARLAKMGGYIGRAAKLGAAGNFMQRALVNAAAGLPVDALQSWTLPESEAAKVALDKQERGIPLEPEDEFALDDHHSRQWLTLAFGLGAGGAGGAILEGASNKIAPAVAQIRKIRGVNKDDLARSVDEMIVLGALAERTKKARAAASQAWNRGRMDVRRQLLDGLDDDSYALAYKDLSKEHKSRLMQRFGAPSDSQLNTSVQPADAGAKPPADGTAQTTVQPAQPTPTPTPSAAGAPAAVQGGVDAGARVDVDEGASGGAVREITERVPAGKTMQETADEILKIDDELAALRAENERLRQSHAEVERRARSAEREAEIDGLTGLPNQKAWLKALPAIEADPDSRVVILDMKQMKAWNDTQGQAAGDEVLRELGNTLGDHRAFRIGGDEFAVVVKPGAEDATLKQIIDQFGLRDIPGTPYKMGVRGAAGGTYKEASEALEAVKRLETGPKARVIERNGDVQINEGGPNTRVGDGPTSRTLEDVDNDIDLVDSALESGEINDAVATARLAALAQEKRAIKAGPGAAAAPTTTRTPKIKLPDTVGNDLGKFEADVLANTKRGIRTLLNGVEKGSEEEQVLLTEFKRISDFEAKRDGGQAATLYMHPSVGGGVLGAAAGFMYPTDDPDERVRNAVLFGAVGLAGGIYAGRRWGAAAKAKPNLPPWEKVIADKVVNTDQLHQAPTPLMLRMHTWFGRLARRSYQVERAQAALGGENLPTMRNAARLFTIFGRWRAQTESWLIDGPSMIDKDGNVKPLEALPLQQIAQLVEGDTDALGRVMASLRGLELYAKGVLSGLDVTAARATALNASQTLLDGAAASRQYAGALADVMDDANLLVDREKMSDIFYAPLNRIFNGNEGSTPALQTITQKIKNKIIGVANPAKFQKGGTQQIINPFEALIDNTARTLRAAELNKIGIAFADLLDAADPTLANAIGKRLHGSQLKQVPEYALKVKELQIEMAKNGTHVSQTDAERIINTMSNEALSVADDVLRIWRNGKIEQWRLNPAIAEAFRSLNPGEMDMLVRFIGLPSQAARMGITNDPIFVFRQAFRDTWQATLNSQYGFVPGWDNLRGWFHIISRSKEYKDYIAGGGGYGALAEQRFTRGKTALPDVKRAPTSNEIDKAIQEARELKLASAYQTLINPVIEAARMGEYLRARGAGASTIDAVYAAKHVTGNFENIGTKMRGIGHLALFLNPAIRSLDQAIQSFKRDPVSYMVKAFVGVSLPSYYFWHTYQDDAELNQLRQTETGRKYWWARAFDGTIVKIPKPILDGQLFGSTVETALDQMKSADPMSAELTRKAVMQDVSVNLMPLIGVVPYELSNNVDFFTGAPIVPAGKENLASRYQYGHGTSTLARMVGKEADIAPAKIDFAVRSVFGTLGAQTIKAISAAVDYQDKGYVPPKEELPFVNDLLGRFPSMNVKSIREFYDKGKDIDEVAKTMGHMAKYDQENLQTYILANKDKVVLVDAFRKAREELGELRGSIEMMRELPSTAISHESRKEIIDELMRTMISRAEAMNKVRRAIQK